MLVVLLHRGFPLRVRGKDRLAAPFVVSLFVITGVLVMRVYVCACVRMCAHDGFEGKKPNYTEGA